MTYLYSSSNLVSLGRVTSPSLMFRGSGVWDDLCLGMSSGRMACFSYLPSAFKVPSADRIFASITGGFVVDIIPWLLMHDMLIQMMMMKKKTMKFSTTIKNMMVYPKSMICNFVVQRKRKAKMQQYYLDVNDIFKEDAELVLSYKYI